MSDGPGYTKISFIHLLVHRYEKNTIKAAGKLQNLEFLLKMGEVVDRAMEQQRDRWKDRVSR